MTDQSPPTAGLLDQWLGYYNCNRLSYNYNPATGKYPDAYAYNSSGNQIMSWAGSAYIPDRAVDAANELYFVAANGDYNQAAAQYDLAGNQISLEQGGETGAVGDREVRRLGPARRGQRRQRPSDRDVHLRWHRPPRQRLGLQRRRRPVNHLLLPRRPTGDRDRVRQCERRLHGRLPVRLVAALHRRPDLPRHGRR